MNREQGTRQKWLIQGLHYLLDTMFVVGIIVTVTLPFTVPRMAVYYPQIQDRQWEVILIYFMLGVFCLFALQELRRIFATVKEGNCFVEKNVVSLQRMGNVFLVIALVLLIRGVVYLTPAIVIECFLFLLAGLFCRVIAMVFAEAVRYKEENDLTI
ncbi:MAG: DUF2975 domain-containing protein [Lachnospiraceae bacterium]|nr:DUF2975 domain-containing protein [Lachnospiraceae bacterium]